MNRALDKVKWDMLNEWAQTKSTQTRTMGT